MRRLADPTFPRPRTSSVPQHLWATATTETGLLQREPQGQQRQTPEIWADPDGLPPSTLDYISAAIGNLAQERHFSEYGWESAIR